MTMKSSDKSEMLSSLGTQLSFTIQASERGVPLLSVPNCSSQAEVNRKKRPSLEILPSGWVLKYLGYQVARL
jgi:hypothetical protein